MEMDMACLLPRPSGLDDHPAAVIGGDVFVALAGIAFLRVGHESRETLGPRALEIDEPREDVHYLLLDHNPDHLLKLQDYDWDVAFSGHAHGGQIKIPFIEWRPHTNLENNHLARPGIHEIFPKRYLCESVGLGNLYELRIFCKPDITILDIK